MASVKDPISPQQIQKIRKFAGPLSFGSISLIFQDGKLIQIEKSEKIRLDRAENKSS